MSRHLVWILLVTACSESWSTAPSGLRPADEGLPPLVEHPVDTGGFTVCQDCHRADFDATTRPPHAPNRFGTTCVDCHRSEGVWNDVRFDGHPASVPLEGGHAGACAGCHVETGPRGVTCADCHMDAYAATTAPDHRAGGFATTCETCHGTSAWRPAGFDHTRVAGQACAGCHLANYQATTTPDHEAGGFATTCETCHGTSAWRPAGFDHARIGTQACASCHMDRFLAATQPDHQSPRLPTTCEGCHTTTAWQPSTFDHEAEFPIATGAHSRYRAQCDACHRAPADVRVFSCTTGCHGQASTDADHLGESGYAYESAACLRCHPNGRH